MAYKDFKAYMQANHSQYLLDKITEFVNDNHDGLGFHSINVLSLCNQKVDNLEIKSIRCNSYIDPFVKVDINITADIVMLGLGKSEYEANRKTHWFTVYTVVNLRDGFEFKDDDTRVKEFEPGTFDKTTALDEFCVPYVYRADLEEIADTFSEFYAFTAPFYDMYKMPYPYILEEMGIKAYEADLPENTMGRMYFKEDKATVYRDFYRLGTSKYEETIEPGTMLISRDNTFMHATGSYMLTIAHEIIHWYYHKSFFKILSLLDDSKSMMPCDVVPDKYEEDMSSLQKAMWFVEWQASAIGMRIAMPQDLFIKAMHEARAEVLSHPVRGNASKADQLEEIIGIVAKLFDVPPYAAKQRAIQLGCDVAAGTFIKVDGRRYDPFSYEDGYLDDNQTFVINKEQLESVCAANKEIAALLHAKKLIYLGHLVCINDEKYIEKVDLHEQLYYGCSFKLTDYARDHVDECCLAFNWVSFAGKKDDGGFYGQCFLNNELSAGSRVEYTFDKDFEPNQSKLDIEGEVAKYMAAFEAEEKILRELYDKRTLADTLTYHMDRKNITVEALSERSGIGVTSIKNYRSGKSNPPLENIMALCIGLNLPEKYSEHMLGTERYVLQDRDLKEKVYRILIREHHDGNIHQWNEILEGFKLSTIPDRRNQKIS